ncbi:MAG: hypothetical protein M4579_001725 [Chaenotheca gracillima]|nr:MAG: hypothetical protein M4579_001725 [Chaenotheca gracillima]
MGCGPSRPSQGRGAHGSDSRPLTVSAPQGGLQMIPAPQRDYQGRPIHHEDYDLNRTNLNRALGYVAEYMSGNRQEITLITVGGAVNTILLRSRETTHDVDFFSSGLKLAQSNLLRAASQNAAARSSIPLGANWLNNSTVLYIGQALQRELEAEAREQNEVVFGQPGLVVLAAPWRYALCGKIDRLSKRERRPYDLRDAATYLNRYIGRHGVRTVPAAQIRQWCARYDKMFSESVVRELDVEFYRMYRKKGVAL